MPTDRTILIVDDDPATVATLARMLEVCGYGVLTANDAESGLQQLVDGHPDAAIVDLRLPTLDGLVFMRQLRALDGHGETPVAIVTGDYFVDESMLRELRTLGATVHFKPLWLDDLLEIVQELVSDGPP